MRPILLLTRPEDQARRFAARAQIECPAHDALIAPLSQIVPMPFEPAVFDGVAGIILTSANAVPMLPALPGVPAWCVGPATTQAACIAGLNAHEQGGTAQAMIKALADRRPKGPLIHACGTHLAKDIAGTLAQRGLDATAVPVYQAKALDWSKETRDALKDAQRVIVPLFSPRAARRFVQNLGDIRPSGLRITAISATCAAQLPEDLRARTTIAARPEGAAMMALVASELSQDGPDPLRV